MRALPPLWGQGASGISSDLSLAPTGLVAAALALWGWSIDQLVLGLLLGAAYELTCVAPPSAAVAARLPLLLRACGLAVLTLLGYVIATQSLPNSLYTWLRWLPLLLLPVPVFARLSGGLTPGHLAQALGRPRAPPDDDDIDTTHAFAAITLAAAGTGTGAAGWLYAGYALIAGWALLAHAPRSRLAAAAVMFVGAAAIGHGVHTGIWILQGQVEEWSTELFLELFAGKPDPFRERTRIGDLGRIKLSDRILMRVEVEGTRPASILLRESAFERYRNGEWRNARPKARMATRHGEPLGALRAACDATPDGAALVRRRGVAAASPGHARGREPARQGGRLVPVGRRPGARRATLRRVHRRVRPRWRKRPTRRRRRSRGAGKPGRGPRPRGRRNGLRRGTPAETVAAVRAYFDAGTRTPSTWAIASARSPTFLAADHKGHCEYFASGTVMLLRSLGIPARYAAGYSAQEWSTLERAFVVRNRHAHAWAQAYVDGGWIEVDTTPARWADLEGEAARGFFAPVLDAFSWLLEEIVRAFVDADESALALAIALGRGFRVARNRRGDRGAPVAQARRPRARASRCDRASVARGRGAAGKDGTSTPRSRDGARVGAACRRRSRRRGVGGLARRAGRGLLPRALRSPPRLPPRADASSTRRGAGRRPDGLDRTARQGGGAEDRRRSRSGTRCAIRARRSPRSSWQRWWSPTP
jgi:hypothetical protein